MYLPPLQPVANSDILICGDVEIHPTASVASGVILNASPESRIVIGADVCVGMGVVINAYGGVVDIESGATLGAGVLIIGQSTVGSNACIGTTTTIFNASVESMAVVTPGSIIGDTTRRWVESESSSNGFNSHQSVTENSHPQDSKSISQENIETIAGSKKASAPRSNHQPNSTIPKTQTESKPNDSFSSKNTDPWTEEKAENNLTEVITTIDVQKLAKNLKNPENMAIGKVYIDELLVTLFPHKKTSNDASVSDDT